MLLNILLYLATMAIFFGGTYTIGRYRRVRLGPGYRGERDVTLWLAQIILGGLLLLLVVWFSIAQR